MRASRTSSRFPRPSRPSTRAHRELGIVAVRARAIVALAQAVASGDLQLDPARTCTRRSPRSKRLPGVGPWTAQYIAMRALAWPDAFPSPDVAVLNALDARARPRERSRAPKAGGPWRAYAVLHLWKSLEKTKEKP
jgi:AraC family transcriptional regulator of adaptative response / DNA-3-methyladenine glycosylase II